MQNIFIVIGSNSAIAKEFSCYVSSLGHHVIGISKKGNKNVYLNEFYLSDDKRVKDILGNLSGNEVILYCAWRSPKRSKNGEEVYEKETSITELFYYLDLINIDNLNRFIFISSAGAVYGDNNKINKEDLSANPITDYGKEKLSAEEILKKLEPKLKLIICRVTNPYGFMTLPENGIGFIDHAIYSALSNKQINIFGTGKVLRDYIHIFDVCSYIFMLSQQEVNGIFNVGSGKSIKIIDIALLIQDKFSNTEIKYFQVNDSPIKKSIIDIKKLRNIINIPTIDFRDWIEDNAN